MTEAEAEARAAHLTLALVPGIGAVRFHELVERFGTPAQVLTAELASLCEVSGISTAGAAAIHGADREAAKHMLAALEALGGVFLRPEDASFPAALREIPEPPTFLFAQGSLDLLDRPAVAIVGSRSHTQYGAQVCRAIASAAAAAGLVVVSGMARGLDAIAHAGALEANGGTIGVLGNGLGVVYPAENRTLYDEVVARGLFLTEFVPGERPSRGGFQRRNRLISGLARVTVVVEAGLKSGALRTADYALDQGREVMAVPGPVTSPVSIGTNRLLRDGAGPLLELGDLLKHFPETERDQGVRAAGPPGATSPLEECILNALQLDPLPAELLIEQSGAPAELALEALSALELRGSVVQEGGGRYRLVAAALFR